MFGFFSLCSKINKTKLFNKNKSIAVDYKFGLHLLVKWLIRIIIVIKNGIYRTTYKKNNFIF